jgi:hypothetical protein
MTTAQLRLLSNLTRIIRDEPEERKRRWRENADRAAVYAREGLLLLTREWAADLLLDSIGRVVVKDTENGNPLFLPATEIETRLALFSAIEPYPELLTFLPPRPDGAVSCPSCGGTGVLEIALTNANLRNLRCECFGAGWLPSGQPSL